ncbi:MAG: hypothetical protein FWC77_06115 [Defluviitaleaceae bacterium]|nr:hypothetical protein [Defluviitaleaceae bacterium]
MKNNIYIKSLLRQPVRTFILAVLIGIASFAFVSRWVEYFIISTETTRLEEYFRPVGQLRNLDNPEEGIISGVEFVSESPLVRFENRSRYGHATLNQTPPVNAPMGDTWLNATGFIHYDIFPTDVYFYGTVEAMRPWTFSTRDGHWADEETWIPYHFQYVPGGWVNTGYSFVLPDDFAEGAAYTMEEVNAWPIMWQDTFFLYPFYIWTEGHWSPMFFNQFQNRHMYWVDRQVDVEFFVLYVTVDEVVAGHVDHVPYGRTMRLLLSADEMFTLGFFSRPTAELLEDRLPVCPEAGLPELTVEIGGSYLFRGTFFDELNFRSFYPGTVGNPARQQIVADTSDENHISFYGSLLLMPLCAETDLWYLPAYANLAPQVSSDIDRLNINQRTLQITTVRDMTAMPIMEQVGHEVQLTSGRWINYDDYLNARPVVVMHRLRALSLRLGIGSTLTLQLRDLTYHWSLFVPGYYDWESHPYTTVEFEIVGLYLYGAHTFTANNFGQMRNLFIPDSVLPAHFGVVQPGQPEWFVGCDTYSFVLTSPRYQDEFILRYGHQMLERGLTLFFRDDYPAVFASAADALVDSLTVNLIVFSVTSLTTLMLAVFIYLRQVRRDFAIMRALGSSAMGAGWRMFVPAILFWVPAGAVGAAGAWHFAVSRATSALYTFGAELYMPQLDTSAEISVYTLLALCAVVFAVAFVALFIGVIGTARVPVFELLQGVRAKHTRKRAPQTQEIYEKDKDAGHESAPVHLNEFTLSDFVDKPTNRNAYNAEWRRILLQTLRSPARTAVTVGIAVALVLALSWVQVTITGIEEELDYLYANTTVRFHVRPVSNYDNDRQPLSVSTPMGNVIRWATMNALNSSELVGESYIVAGANSKVFLPSAGFVAGVNSWDELVNHEVVDYEGFIHRDVIYGFNSFEHFLRYNPYVSVTFHDGFDRDSFAFDDWDFETLVPIIVHEDMLAKWGLYPGDTTSFTSPERRRARFAPYTWYVQIIGTYTGTVSRNIPGGNEMLEGAVLMPLNPLYFISPSIHYTAMYFYLDPAMTRYFHDFRELANYTVRFAFRAGTTRLMTFMDDGGLRYTAIPLERNLAFLRILHPVTLVLCFVLGMGFAGLLMAQNAKTAAMLRMFGATKKYTLVVLCIEILALAFVGAALGVVVMPLLNIPLLLLLAMAGFYLLSAGFGAVIGAALISRHAPMELLQIKE